MKSFMKIFVFPILIVALTGCTNETKQFDPNDLKRVDVLITEEKKILVILQQSWKQKS